MPHRLKFLFLLAALALAAAAFAQQSYTVRGKVSDRNGEPLPGTYVTVKGDLYNGVMSDADGNYAITVRSANAVLEFSLLGMRTVQEPLNGRAKLDVTLTEDYTQLDQSVIIGYGAVKKKDIAGSIQNLTSTELQKVNTPDFERAMQGRISGVQIVSSSGIPGSSFSILVRGRGSISADTEPLYIVDGVQMVNGSKATGVLTNANSMGGLNPDDIESITVLKDGASASIYGAQAANGVVIITTKRGQDGRTRVSFKATAGAQQLARRVEIMNARQWASFVLEEYKNYDAVYGTTYEQEYRNLFTSFGWGEDGLEAPNTDWYDEIFRRAVVQNYELSLSGGTSKTRFFISANYSDTQGIIKYTGAKRAGARINLSHDIAPWLTLNSSNNFSLNNYDQASTTAAANPSRTAMFLLPGISPYDKDGNYVMDLPYGYYQYNVPQQLMLNEYTGKISTLLSSNDLTFKILPGLEFKSSYNFQFSYTNEHQYSDPRTRQGYRYNGVVTAYAFDTNTFQTEQVLTFNREFGIHALNAVAGFSYNNYQRHNIGASAQGVSNPDLKLLSSASTPQTTSESYVQWKMAGFFTRIGYTLNNKYIFSGTLRYDGSSRFGENNKWGLFPSVSAAWRIKQEPFLQNVNWISDLKLRASYGVTGNASIGNYVSNRLYSGGYAYNGEAGIMASSIGNPRLSWEKRHSKNVGITAGFFNDRLGIDVDLYRDDTKDLLYYRRIPTTTGFSSIPSNMGGVRNEGVDLQINTVNFDTSGFRWETAFNFSYTKNYITELQDGLDEIGSYKVGQPITAERIYKWAGVNASNGYPMYYDKDGYITYNPTLEDRFWNKGRDPKFYGGLMNTLSWKGFTLSVFLQFQAGAQKYWSDKTVLIGQAADNNLLAVLYTDSWKKPGDVTWVPRPFYSGTYPGGPMNYDNNSDPGMSLIYESTDFLKLKNVTFSYDFPATMLKKIRLSGLQIFVDAYNIYTLTNYGGYDPESIGNDRGLYPQSKSVSAGLKLNF